jgi:hypothetical protein
MSSIPNNPGSPQTYPGARMASHATSLQAGAPMDSSQVPFYVFNTHEEAETLRFGSARTRNLGAARSNPAFEAWGAYWRCCVSFLRDPN